MIFKIKETFDLLMLYDKQECSKNKPVIGAVAIVLLTKNVGKHPCTIEAEPITTYLKQNIFGSYDLF